MMSETSVGGRYFDGRGTRATPISWAPLSTRQLSHTPCRRGSMVGGVAFSQRAVSAPARRAHICVDIIRRLAYGDARAHLLATASPLHPHHVGGTSPLGGRGAGARSACGSGRRAPRRATWSACSGGRRRSAPDSPPILAVRVGALVRFSLSPRCEERERPTRRGICFAGPRGGWRWMDTHAARFRAPEWQPALRPRAERGRRPEPLSAPREGPVPESCRRRLEPLAWASDVRAGGVLMPRHLSSRGREHALRTSRALARTSCS